LREAGVVSGRRTRNLVAHVQNARYPTVATAGFS